MYSAFFPLVDHKSSLHTIMVTVLNKVNTWIYTLKIDTLLHHQYHMGIHAIFFFAIQAA